jgi:AraC-like DNA-binding protein
MPKRNAQDFTLPATFLASMGRVLWRVAEANKLDPTRFFSDAGLDPARIEEPRARFPFDTVCDAWQLLATLTEKTHIGLEAGQYYRPADLHALGITFLASANLLEALHRLDRYETVLNSNVDFDVLEEGRTIRFVCTSLDIPWGATRIVEDLRNSVIVDLSREGIGEKITPVEVGFTYPQPVYLKPYRQLFDCPIKFSTERSYVSFTKQDATRPFTARNADLARGNDAILDGLLQTLPDQNLVSRVKQIIAKSLPSGTPTEAAIAKSIYTSPRTLHRRLAEEQTSFREVMTEVRQELAEGYLQDKSIPITEISYLIGFSDVSAFSRAFKRWTGISPAAYRSQ